MVLLVHPVNSMLNMLIETMMLFRQDRQQHVPVMPAATMVRGGDSKAIGPSAAATRTRTRASVGGMTGALRGEPAIPRSVAEAVMGCETPDGRSRHSWLQTREPLPILLGTFAE